MYYSTTEVYATKRKTVNFAKSLVSPNKKVESKFVADTIFGMLKSESVILKDIATALNEPIQIKNTIDRLSQNLQNVLSVGTHVNYLRKMVSALGKNPVILVDDSDVIKPHGKKFEALGLVRDGSSEDKKLEKGYMKTEIVGLTVNKKQPVSLFTHIHSSLEKSYKSTNHVLYSGLEQVIGALNTKATFVFDRGYDMNSLFHFMDKREQNFILRIKKNRKLFWKGKWYKASTLRDSRKGKIRTNLTFREDGKQIKKTVYISHLNIQVTASKRDIVLVIIYGLGETPMLLTTNKAICCRKDVINIVRTYMSRWRIEEYFRFKKQHFNFEGFRVRSLRSINNLNQLLTYAIGLLALMADKLKTSMLSQQLIANARALRKDIQFYYYQLAKGMSLTLGYARTGIQEWFTIKKENPRQLEIKWAS